MLKVKSGFNKLLWFYLFLNPVLDIISGAYIYAEYKDLLDVFDVSIGLTPSLVVRMAMLLVFAVYVLCMKDKRSILTAIPMAAALALSMFSEYRSLGDINYLTDLQYFAKFCYNIAVIMAYGNYFASCGYNRRELFDRVSAMLCIVSFILCAGIILPYIFDVGFYTYADRFGYRGFRGVFYSGNDITATLMLITPLTFCRFMSLSRKKPTVNEFVFYGLAPVLSTLCLLVIGTKTAFLAIAIALVCTLIYAISLRRRDKKDKALNYILYTFLGIIICTSILSLLAWKSVFTTIATSFGGFSDAAQESTKTLVLSGRNTVLSTTFQQFKSGGPVTWLFGLGRGSVRKVIEMDLFEVVFYYGIFGAAAMLWLYLKLGFGFVIKFFKNIKTASFKALGAFISMGTCVFYLAIAGHVLFSVTSGFFFAFVLLYGDYFCFKSSALPDGSQKLPDPDTK